MSYDPFKHHRRSIRLKGYVYSQAGASFVTICTKNRESLFGEIANDEMQLNEYGQIIHDEWMMTAQLRPYVELDAFVIMPNHFHGILVIVDGAEARRCRAFTTEQFGKPVAGSLPTLIRAFKSATTNRINELRDRHGAKVWQHNYYEHIIRNERALNAIREYIDNNPTNWANDKDNLKNIHQLHPPETIDDYLHDIGYEHGNALGHGDAVPSTGNNP